MLDDYNDDRSDAQAPDVQEVIAELHATQRELDEAHAKFTSAHADKKHLEAKLSTRVRHANANLDFDHKCLEEAFNTLATEAMNFKPLGKEQTSNLELVKFDALLAEQEEDISWLVDGCVAPGTMNALAGPPKIGKSVLLRQLAVAVATGTPWLDRECPRSDVLWLGVEDPRRAARRHFRDMGADPSASIRFWSGPPPPPEEIPTDEWVHRLILRYEIKMVIIENFGKMAAVQDFNDYSVVTEALRPYEMLVAKTDVAIVLGLHTRKSGGEDGQAVLGSTQWLGSPSTVFEISRDGDSRLLSSVQREGEGMPSTLLRWNAETRTYSLGQSRKAAEAEQVKQDVLDFIREHSGASTSEIADGVGRKRQYVTTTLRKMVEEGWLERTGRGQAGDPYRYSLA